MGWRLEIRSSLPLPTIPWSEPTEIANLDIQSKAVVMSTTIKLIPLFVGLTASSGTSFLALEMVADRRCLYLRRDVSGDLIASQAYKTVSYR